MLKFAILNYIKLEVAYSCLPSRSSGVIASPILGLDPNQTEQKQNQNQTE